MTKQAILLTDEIVPPPALVRAGLEALPAIIRAQGERASRRFIEFFTASIRNRNTRMAYARAVKQFFDWCDERRLKLEDIEAISVATYVEQLGGTASKPTVKQHLAAIRQLFDYLTTGGVLDVNPAASVRGPKHVVRRGKTPVLSSEEARKLLDSIENNTLIGLRDRALIGTMVYSFARVGAVVSMKAGDYFQHRRRWWLRLHEKGGKRHEVPCHPSLEEYLNAWVSGAAITRDKKGPLFRSMGKGDRLGDKPMSRFDVLHMIKRRAEAAGLPYSTCCHTFRATGITTYLENGGTLEHAQTIANHESPRTTKLYDRTRETLVRGGRADKNLRLPRAKFWFCFAKPPADENFYPGLSPRCRKRRCSERIDRKILALLSHNHFLGADNMRPLQTANSNTQSTEHLTVQLVQQEFRFPKIRRTEALGKPTINSSEHGACFIAAVQLREQPCEACRCATHLI